jgi:hypothetical protein
MLYIGFPITIEEALRILKLDESLVNTFYHTEPIDLYLKSKGSKLRFKYIDKGTCAFGLPLENYHMSVEDAVIQLLQMKKAFWNEVESLQLDLSSLAITWVEQETQDEGENPQPYLLVV